MAATADKFSRLAALKPTRPIPARPAAIRTPDEVDSLGRLLGAGVARNHFGEHLSIRNWFSTPETTDPSSTTLTLLSRTRDESLSRKTRAALEDPEKWLFLDTETTGLAGGTGTYAFLIGLAWWDAGGLQVEQFFMRDFAEEHSLLHELSHRIAERPVLVTVNGKSFDWPLLENRFTMTRSIAVPNAVNEIESLDLFGLSRFLQRRGDPDRAHSACAQALAMGLPAEFRPKARRDLALMAKRRGEHARAAEIWLQIVADLHDGIHACEQLAIYYERHARDLAKAAEFAQLAIAKLLRERANSRDPLLTARVARLEKKFLQRVARLEKKSRPSSSARPRDARPVAAPKASSGLW